MGGTTWVVQLWQLFDHYSKHSMEQNTKKKKNEYKHKNIQAEVSEDTDTAAHF